MTITIVEHIDIMILNSINRRNELIESHFIPFYRITDSTCHHNFFLSLSCLFPFDVFLQIFVSSFYNKLDVS